MMGDMKAAREIKRFEVAVGDGFRLEEAVCFYGFFVLAPNRWLPAEQVLVRPLRVEGKVIEAHVSQKGAKLAVQVKPGVSEAGKAEVDAAIRRMLRLDEGFADWWAKHAEAKRRGFGRMFRSPSVFEDVVKTFTTCNVTWPNTKRMNELLVSEVGGGAFPGPARLAAVTEEELKAMAKVGYRAARMIRLAEDVLSGAVDLAGLEDPQMGDDERYKRLRAIHGLGPYGAANMCQLLGDYERVPIDSETHRHFCKKMKLARPRNAGEVRKLNAKIERHYGKWEPYQFLAYWYDLWLGYEEKLEKESAAWLHEETSVFTASEMG